MQSISKTSLEIDCNQSQLYHGIFLHATEFLNETYKNIKKGAYSTRVKQAVPDSDGQD